jgi:hypothetical protein
MNGPDIQHDPDFEMIRMIDNGGRLGTDDVVRYPVKEGTRGDVVAGTDVFDCD